MTTTDDRRDDATTDDDSGASTTSDGEPDAAMTSDEDRDRTSTRDTARDGSPADSARDGSAAEPDLTQTHTLVCDRFGEAFAAVFELVRQEMTAAIVRLDEDELSLDIEGDDTAPAWESIRDRFERVADGDESETVWRCPTTTAEGRDALLELLSHTDGVVGAYFVREIQLRRDDEVLASAVPHHSQASLDATRCETVADDEIVDLAGVAACLVPTGPAVTWVDGDRRWRLAGKYLCAERIDGRPGSCYGLSNLQAASVRADGTLELSWDAGTVGDDAIGRALTWVMNRLYRPPTDVPCPDPERAETVRARMQEILAAYDGRTL
ncbi:hypothetical protein [Halovivax cerinus]|uniref:Uncharacterized protein n=1 Tax=Halovivax cerinus TaxID=1487865 RepID=A0ABD5NKU1_9EURY|nr:hypothetical protein [Halovivax cerinus]